MDSHWSNARPDPNEYAPYYQNYIEKVPEGNLLDIFKNLMEETTTLINSLSSEQAARQYNPDKWSVSEVIGHIIDNERIMGTRALCISRGETKQLPGYDQELYIANGNYAVRSLKSLSKEYRMLRSSHIEMFSGFSSDMLQIKGNADGKLVSVRAVAFIMAGHERHHLDILYDKYQLEVSEKF